MLRLREGVVTVLKLTANACEASHVKLTDATHKERVYVDVMVCSPRRSLRCV